MKNLIKAALAAQKKEASIVDALEERLGGWEKARPFNDVRASMLTSETVFCAREVVLAQKLEKKPKDVYLPAAMRATFDLGRALHDLFREEWLQDLVVGDWRCGHCGHEKTFTKKPKLGCPQCHHLKWEYREVQVTSEGCGVSGSIDALLDLGGSKLILTEIKTLDKDFFKVLKGPYAEHKARTALYLSLVQDDKKPQMAQIDQTYGKVLYISKGYGAKDEMTGKISPFREFDIEYDAELVAPYRKKAWVVKEAKEKGLIPSGVCPNSFCPRAKNCCVIQECWSGKYPADALEGTPGG